MKSCCSLDWCALALSLLVPSLAWGAEPSLALWAQRRVQDGLIKPLARQQPRRFSRVRPPPREHRVRVTNEATTLDKNGRGFLPFAVDVRFGSPEWKKDDIVGCVYAKSGKILVKIGDAYRPAEVLLGKDVSPVPGACEATPPKA